MSRLTDNFLFDVIVLVATLQSAISRGQSQLADNKENNYQFALGSMGTKEENEKHNKQNFLNNQLITTKRFSYRSAIFVSYTLKQLHKTYSRQPSKLLFVETRFLFWICCIQL